MHIMKNKQLSPTHRFFMRPEKPTPTSHNSGSTIETSDQKLPTKLAPKEAQAMTAANKQQKDSSQTISVLRKELKNIKMEVTKLIEQGFVKASLPTQWLESSGNMSSLSRSSKLSGVVGKELYGHLEASKRKSEGEGMRNSFVFSYQQMIKLRQQCENLRNLYRIQQQKQAQVLQKQKQLFQQVKALRKCKQQLSKCIQILQSSLKQTNIQMNYYIQESQRLDQEVQRNRHENEWREHDFMKICAMKERLEEELEFRKAENNQLIRIIEYKESQVEELRRGYSGQIQDMEMQYRLAVEERDDRCRIMEQNYEVLKRTKSLDPKNFHSMQKFQIERLQTELQTLKSQLSNRQKIMAMMLNDIKTMDKQLLACDEEHRDLLRCRQLIDQLNEKLVGLEMKRMSNKYKYC